MQTELGSKWQVCLINGIGQNAQHWNPHLLESLRSRDWVDDVVGFDLPGTGRMAHERSPTLIPEYPPLMRRFYERELATEKPRLLVALSLGTLAIIVGGLIPSIAPIFGQSGKPMPTSIQVMMALHERWIEIATSVAVVLSLLLVAVSAAARKPEVRQRLDRLKLRLPVVGSFLLQQEAARFTRTLGTMLKAGVPLIQAARRTVDRDGATRG